MAKTVEDELAGPSVFKDRAVLDYDWVPRKLWHRDGELGQLTQLFRGVAEGSMSQRALITGGVGTGKTALSKRFCMDFEEACRKKGVLIEHVVVNCRRNASEGLVLYEMLRHFDKNYPQRGYSTQEMLKDLRKHIERRGVHLIVVLDEADALLLKEKDVVYTFTRFDDERTVPKPSLSLILVSAKEDLPSMLDEATRSTVKRTNLVTLVPYNAAQLRDILRERADLAFHKNVVADDVIKLIANIAAEEGDARYAIELLEGAGRSTDAKHRDRVEAEDVRAVKAHTRSVVSEARLRNLQRHPLFVLLAVARKLKRSRKTFLTTGEVEGLYALVAEEYGESARAHTQFWKYLKELETADWIRVEKQDPTPEGQTQRISLPDLPAEVLVEKVQGMLADRER